MGEGDPFLFPFPLEDLAVPACLAQGEVAALGDLVEPCDQVCAPALGEAYDQGVAPFPSAVEAPLDPGEAPYCGDASCLVGGIRDAT